MSKIPTHVAIIMDGNGRWAVGKGLPKIAGHRAGAETVERVMSAARDAGVKILTLYAFSTENWSRPKNEVSALFKLLEEYIEKKAGELHEKGVRLNAIGRIDELPGPVREKLRAAMERTKANASFCLNLALNYGGRAEITDAARKIAGDCLAGRLKADSIDEKTFARYLYTNDIPDPDLLIRTSGEMRVSNFLLWQISYAEIYVTDKLWPDFKKTDFDKAIAEYRNRERRYGG
jgi:undecaprenyl diphosphate synthase